MGSNKCFKNVLKKSVKEKDNPQNGKNPYKDTHREFISNTYKQLDGAISRNKQSNKKISHRFKFTFLQRRHRDGHKTQERILSLTSS